MTAPSPFNPSYTFDSFVLTPYNEAAFEAALRIVREPGRAFNPLFIYGGMWAGKTHLLHAVGNALAGGRGAGMRVECVEGKVFLAEVREALGRRRNVTGTHEGGGDTRTHFANLRRALARRAGAKLASFYARWAVRDVLMIDGFQAFAGDDLAQNVVMRLADLMRKEHRQVVLASTLPLYRFPVAEEYFRSAFDLGLVTDMMAPEDLVKNRELLWE